MIAIRALKTFPPELELATLEIAAGLGALYGEPAQQAYRRVAPTLLSVALTSPEAYAWGAFDEGRFAGFLIALVRDAAAEISLFHLLHAFTGRGIEDALLRHAVAAIRALGIEHIVFDAVPYCSLSLEDTFSGLGFTTIERQLLEAPLVHGGLGPACRRHATQPANETHWPEMARCLADTYRDNPNRPIHLETRSAAHALDYIQRVATGGFGHLHEDYLRVVLRDGVCMGFILGCEIVPGWGFVLHVAVRPEYAGHGIGTDLVRDLAAVFHARGMENISLGVTSDNPARRLYERLGFRKSRDVAARFWRKTG